MLASEARRIIGQHRRRAKSLRHAAWHCGIGAAEDKTTAVGVKRTDLIASVPGILPAETSARAGQTAARDLRLPPRRPNNRPRGSGEITPDSCEVARPCQACASSYQNAIAGSAEGSRLMRVCARLAPRFYGDVGAVEPFKALGYRWGRSR